MTKTSRRNCRNPSKQKFDVFDFSQDDEHIEKSSKKFLLPYKPQKPKKFGSPVTKYTFLSFFAGGKRSSQNDLVKEILSVDDNDDIAEKKLLETGASVASNSSNLKPSSNYCVDYIELECDTPEAKICSTRGKIPVCSIADGKSLSGRPPLAFIDNEPVILDSDDDTKIKSSKPVCYLPENEGSGNLLELMQSHNIGDKGPLVVVKTNHVFYGEKLSPSTTLTFSCSCIKLEGSFSFGTELSFTYEWELSAIVSIKSLWCESESVAIVDLHLKSEDARVNKVDYESSDGVLLEFSAYDPDWLETEEAIKRLDMRYKDKWIEIAALESTRSLTPFLGQEGFSASKNHCPISNSIDNFEEVIYPEGDPDAVSISKTDIDLLQPKTFINDTIVDFYIMYLKNKMSPEEKDRFHFFNSFFFRKLADLDKDPACACEGRAAFQRVRRWTAKIDIFGKDFIFVPVNFSLHWSLIVICHPGEVASLREKEMEKSSRVPCILHMNSIRGSHKGLKKLIQSYLLEEWKERHKVVSKDVAMKFPNLQFVSLKLPQQGNSFDCGLFLLHYVELFLEQTPVNFNPSQITASSKFLAENWFSTEDVASKRECIKKLIFEIAKNRVQKVSPADSDDNYTSHCSEEENTCFKIIQETCNAREEACHGNGLSLPADELLAASPVANISRGFKNVALSELASRDLRDSAKPLVDHSYLQYGEKALLNLFSNMPPVEEEDMEGQMSISPAIKTGSQPIQLSAAPHGSRNVKLENLLGGFSLSPDSEKITPSCQGNDNGLPNSLRAEVEEVSGPEPAKYGSPILTDELAGYIVLDSQEEGEDHFENSLANNLSTTSALCHKEVEITGRVVQVVEQAVKKPRHVPEVIELSSSGKGKDQTVSSSTSSEESVSFVHDSEEISSDICIKADSLKPATSSLGNKHAAVKTRNLFRYPRRGRIDLSEDLHVQH